MNNTWAKKQEGRERQFTFSFFRSLWSKDSEVMNLAELHSKVTSPMWQPQTEAYRRLRQHPDRQDDAQKIKNAMPAVIVEGVVKPRSTHATQNLERMSGLAMYDMDHTGTRTADIRSLLQGLPYVAYVHTTISGEGLKAVVYLDAHTPHEYPLAYAICQRTLETVAGHPCDEKCARLTQPCFCAWDPDAYLNLDATPYPWREELKTDPALASLVPATQAGAPGATPCSGGKASPVPPPTEACGYVAAFVNTFRKYNPWQPGNRHSTMLKLGRQARRKGFSKEEMKKIADLVAVDIVNNGYTRKELEKDLTTGYQYVDKAYIPSEKPVILPQLPNCHSVSFSKENPVQDEEDLSINNENMRTSTPYIPKEVYERLPDFLKEALIAARTDRERDILLLGVLTNLSACMPGVSICYDQRRYSPHLYLMVIASSASGKGLLVLAGKLPEAVNKFLIAENKERKEAYERALREWEERNAVPKGKKGKAGGKSTFTPTPADPMPEEPEYHYLCGSPNTSKSQLINRLKTNGELGLIINASELDMMSGAIRQDYGKHDDVMRAAFHHEPVSTDFKGDRQIITAHNPHLALCLAGTPSQLPTFIRSAENGMFGRFLTYTCESNWTFRCAAPIKGQEDYQQLYERLSQKVLQMFLLFRQSPTEVLFTDQQWAEHTAYFGSLLTAVTGERADAPTSIVLRASLMVARIASILTALRKAEGGWSMKGFYCTDEDFHAAMEIVKCTFQHSLLLLSSLPGEKTQILPLRNYFRLAPVYDSLPKTFTYTQIKELSLQAGISERSTARYLAKLIENKYIEKQANGYKKLKKVLKKD